MLQMIDLSDLAIAPEMSDERDILPGSAPKVQETDVYPARIDLAYFSEARSGAWMLTLHLEGTGLNQFKLKSNLVIRDREGSPTFHNRYTGQDQPLRGLAMADHLAQILTGRSLSQLKPKEKVIKLWSYEEKQEVPTKKEVFEEFIGKEIQVALEKIEENKRTFKNNEWVDGPDKAYKNEVRKFFNKEGQTLAEQKAKMPGEYLEKWRTANQGKMRSTYVPPSTPATAAAPMMPTAPAPAISGDTPLFSQDD